MGVDLASLLWSRPGLVSCCISGGVGVESTAPEELKDAAAWVQSWGDLPIRCCQHKLRLCLHRRISRLTIIQREGRLDPGI